MFVGLCPTSNYRWDVGFRQRMIGPTILNSRIKLAIASHSVEYVYSPCPMLSICR